MAMPVLAHSATGILRWAGSLYCSPCTNFGRTGRQAGKTWQVTAGRAARSCDGPSCVGSDEKQSVLTVLKDNPTHWLCERFGFGVVGVISFPLCRLPGAQAKSCLLPIMGPE